MNWYQTHKYASIPDFWKGFIPIIGLGAVLSLISINMQPEQMQLISEKNNFDSAKIKQEVEQITEPGFPSISEEIPQEPKTELKPNYPVARIIASEAGGNVSDYERELVATVIKNRIGHAGFNMGNLENMKDVVSSPGEFEALNDPRNKNWEDLANPNDIPAEYNHIWQHAQKLSTGNFKLHNSPSGRPLVYYHDKSIDVPDNWTNKYWKAIKELETDKFIFYSVIPNQDN